MAQSTGRLRLIMEPAGQTDYVLDGQFRMRDREVSLMEGPHRFVFWAPERRMLDTVLTVVAGGTSDVRISLRYSEEYIQWRKQAEQYETQRRWGLYAPPVIAAGAAAWMVVSYMNYSQAHRELDDLEEAYAASTDPGEISSIKSEDIPAAKDDFAKARTQTIVASSLFVVSTGATWYLRRKLSSRTAPVFEDKERTRFEGLVWVPGGTGGTWMAGLSIPLAR
ncbi:MAG: hypothetical protein ACK46G_01850 [Flavobacteriales bacterium]|jgi:hypothetical protein